MTSGSRRKRPPDTGHLQTFSGLEESIHFISSSTNTNWWSVLSPILRFLIQKEFIEHKFVEQHEPQNLKRPFRNEPLPIICPSILLSQRHSVWKCPAPNRLIRRGSGRALEVQPRTWLHACRSTPPHRPVDPQKQACRRKLQTSGRNFNLFLFSFSF